MWVQTAFWTTDLAIAMACSSDEENDDDDDDDDDGMQVSVQQLVRKIRRSSAPKRLFLARGSPFRKVNEQCLLATHFCFAMSKFV